MIFGSFNPNYKKEDRRRMRYIQLKYAQAYCTGETGDPNTIINDIDPNSKLKMSVDGFKPANPFPDERGFEESLVVNFHPTSGHQGKFCASHAMVSIGAIVEYQVQRKSRLWVPGVSSPGRPNDYINMFLDEMKCWMRSQMTLDQVAADELRKRYVYITKLKNDKYFWCFPPEQVNDAKIHSCIDLVHSRVADALYVTEREEANKSMAQLFKDLNDNSTNAFEFGKSFLAHLLFVSKPAPHDLVCSMKGRTVEAGRLHRILDKATAPMMRLYVQDMKSQQNDIGCGSSNHVGLIENGHEAPPNDDCSRAFTVQLVTFEPSTFSLNTMYLVTLQNPCRPAQDGGAWILRKTHTDFLTLYNAIKDDFDSNEVVLVSPPMKFGNLQLVSTADQEKMCEGLRQFLQSALSGVSDDCSLSNKSRNELAAFVHVKSLPEAKQQLLINAENIANQFISLRKTFVAHIRGTDEKPSDQNVPGSCNKNSSSSSSTRAAAFDLTAELDICRESWGHEGVVAILNAYAQLQRIATVLGWTLEINHFFVSMFGNTLAFCKLPIRELLLTQKDVLLAFQRTASDLYEYACALHAKNNYKWHCNLQVAESTLTRCKHHIDKSVGTITRLEADHLDRDVQMRRLRDVAARFEPFMRRIDHCLPQIQRELGLPLHLINHDTIDYDIGMMALPAYRTGIGNSSGGGGGGGGIGSGQEKFMLTNGTGNGNVTGTGTGNPFNLPPLPVGIFNDNRFEVLDDDDDDDDDEDEDEDAGPGSSASGSGMTGAVVPLLDPKANGPVALLELNDRTEVQIVDNVDTQRSEVCIIM